jgi:hypothetical protein
MADDRQEGRPADDARRRDLRIADPQMRQGGVSRSMRLIMTNRTAGALRHERSVDDCLYRAGDRARDIILASSAAQCPLPKPIAGQFLPIAVAMAGTPGAVLGRSLLFPLERWRSHRGSWHRWRVGGPRLTTTRRDTVAVYYSLCNRLNYQVMNTPSLTQTSSTIPHPRRETSPLGSTRRFRLPGRDTDIPFASLGGSRSRGIYACGKRGEQGGKVTLICRAE